MQILQYGVVIFGLVALGGCAAQSAYREGQSLLERGESKAGLAKLQDAVTLEPRSATYRQAYLQARERVLEGYLDTANKALSQGKLDDSERSFRQVLAIDGGNERALAGVRRVGMTRRHDALLREAEDAFARQEITTARAALRTLQIEGSTNERALALKRRIDEKTAKSSTEKQLAETYRKPISIMFKDVPIKTVFEVISRTSGLNFVLDKDVPGDQKTTVFLRNSRVDAAIQVLLLTNQLEQRVLDENTLLIYPNSPAKLKDYQQLSVRSFFLSSADAKSIANALKSTIKIKEVNVDEKFNLVVVRDSPEAIRMAEKLVAMHDVPEPEVMLEVEILEIKRTRLLELGLKLPGSLTLKPLSSGDALTLAELQHLRASSVGATVDPLTLRANKLDTDANLLANPRIRARNREKAKILIGERVPNISTTATSTGFVSEAVTYIDVGLKLDVEPTVYPDNEIVLKVSMEVSNIVSQVQTKSGTLAYQIGTRTASSVLRLRDGENQVLAGLISDEDRRTANKFPGFGEIPILGRLFGSQSDDSTKSEIVLSITPRILRNIPKREAEEIEFETGTENKLGLASSIVGAVTPPPAQQEAGSPNGHAPQ